MAATAERRRKARAHLGFLIGEALEQGLAVSGEAPMAPPAFLETLRKERRLRFPFAPSVYKARLEDFYHYRDRLDIPLYRALFLINEQNFAGRARPLTRPSPLWHNDSV